MYTYILSVYRGDLTTKTNADRLPTRCAATDAPIRS